MASICERRELGQDNIFIIRTDGSGRRQLTDDVYYKRVPQWSPDGEKIAFHSDRSGQAEIWTINRDGSGLRQITETGLIFSIWSPDGLQMAGYSPSEGTVYIFDPNRLWNEQTPQRLPQLSDGGPPFQPLSWSPNGRWLGGHSASLVIYSLKSQQYTRLTDIGEYTPHAWLQDSRRLIFHEQGELFVVDRETKIVRKILSLAPDEILTPAVSKDDQWIYFTRLKSEADIWMLTLNDEQK